MEQKEELGRDCWVELLGLYDEFIRLGKTDEHTIELLEMAGLLRVGTVWGKRSWMLIPTWISRPSKVLCAKGSGRRSSRESAGTRSRVWTRCCWCRSCLDMASFAR